MNDAFDISMLNISDNADTANQGVDVDKSITPTADVNTEGGNEPIENEGGDSANLEGENTEGGQQADRLRQSADEVKGELADGKFHEALKPFASFLKEKGIIELIDSEGKEVQINDFDGLGEVLKESIERNRYGNLNESQTRYLEALTEGVPLNEFEENEKAINRINSFTAEKLGLEAQLRFDIIHEDLINKGIDQKLAVNVANGIMRDEDKGVTAALAIVESAKKTLVNRHTELVNKVKESNKIEAEAVAKVLGERKDVLGIELSETFKSNIQKNMLNRAGQTEDGVPLNAFDYWRHTNKAEAEVILNALMIYTDGFTKLDKVKNAVSSKATQELEKVLTSTKFKKEEDGVITVNNEQFKLI